MSTFGPENSLTDIALALERRAQTAIQYDDLVLAAAFAQAAGLYRCADALSDIRAILDAWPTPDA